MKRLVLFILSINLGIAQGNLSLNINLEKEIVFYKEHVFLEIIISNSHHTDVEIQRPYLGTGSLNIVILDSLKNVFEYYGPTHCAPPSQTKISADDNYSEVYDLNFIYGNERGDLFRTYRFKPGKYTIQAKYCSNRDTISSSIRNLIVKEPIDDEEKALHLLTQGFTFFSSNAKLANENAVASFDSLVEKYPKSNYAPSALAQAASICKMVLRDNARANKYYYQLIDKYINSGHSRDAFASLKNEIQSRPDKEEFLKKALERVNPDFGINYVKEYITKH